MFYDIKLQLLSLKFYKLYYNLNVKIKYIITQFIKIVEIIIN